MVISIEKPTSEPEDLVLYGSAINLNVRIYITSVRGVSPSPLQSMYGLAYARASLTSPALVNEAQCMHTLNACVFNSVDFHVSRICSTELMTQD